MTSHSEDYDRLGFTAPEIYSFLERHGVRLSVATAAVPTVKPKPIETDWRRLYVSRKQVSLSDAAKLLATGFAQEEGRDWVSADSVEIIRCKDSLIDAIDGGEIIGGGMGERSQSADAFPC